MPWKNHGVRYPRVKMGLVHSMPGTPVCVGAIMEQDLRKREQKRSRDPGGRTGQAGEKPVHTP